MTKKIAFTGPFGDINFGDYGMIVNNIFEMDIKNVVMFTYNKDFSKFLSNHYLNDYNLDIVSVEVEEFERKSNYAYTPLELITLLINKDEIYENLKDVEKLIVNGGGYFNGLWSKPHRFDKLVKIIGPALVANEMNIPIIFTGNSYGPFGNDSEFFATFFSSLNNVTFATRDQLYSNMWFKQLGVDKPLNFIPDDLLILNDKILDRKNSLSVSSKKYVVIETYLPVEYLKENIEVFKLFVSQMKVLYDLDTVFLPLNIQHGGVDQGKYLASEIIDLEFVDISTVGFLPLEDANTIIKNASLVISSRYHALVFAAANKVPIVSVIRDVMDDNRYYYNKNSGLFRQIFRNLPYEEQYLLKNDYIETLKDVINNFEFIISYQNKLYNSKEYTSNLSDLGSLRRRYITDNITMKEFFDV